MRQILVEYMNGYRKKATEYNRDVNGIIVKNIYHPMTEGFSFSCIQKRGRERNIKPLFNESLMISGILFLYLIQETAL